MMTSPDRPDMTPDAMLAITDLRCQVPRGVLTIGDEPVRLTWRVAPAGPGLTQRAYEIEVASDGAFGAILASTGVVDADEQVAVEAPGGRLESREVRFYRVRLRTEEGLTPWSPVLRVEAGLLRASDWIAQAVTLPDDEGRERQSPSPVLRRQFELAGDISSARLYATSLGIHRLTLNGDPVSEDLLAPGWTTYHHRLIGETYDVSSLLVPGPNVLVG